MSENLNSNHIENDEFNLNTEESDYEKLIVTIFIASFIGWSLGISKNSCNPYFEQNLDQSI